MDLKEGTGPCGVVGPQTVSQRIRKARSISRVAASIFATITFQDVDRGNRFDVT